MIPQIKSDKVKNAADKSESDEKIMIWFQTSQNLKEHVIISGSTSLHGSAIINSRDVPTTVATPPYITCI